MLQKLARLSRRLPMFFAAQFVLTPFCSNSLAASLITPVLNVESKTVNPNQPFSLSVGVSPISDLFAWELQVDFNSADLNVIGVSEGSFLPTAGPTVFVPGGTDNTAGLVTFVGDTLVGLVAGASGSGTLLNIEFAPIIATGSTIVSIRDFIALDSNLNEIPIANGVFAYGTVTDAPEPSTLVMIGLALMVAGSWKRFRARVAVFRLGACCVPVLVVLAFPSGASAQNCLFFLNNKVGDTISVVGTLNTTDPNENGEGEPLLLSSSGGDFTGTVISYSIPQTFTYTATQANESIIGVIVGQDGDESCSITASSTQPHFLTQAQKNFFTNVAAGLAFPATAYTAVAVLCTGGVITGPICGLPAALIAAGSGLVAWASALIALDPPDPNYTQISVPVIPVVPPIVAGGVVTPAIASATNALLANEASIAGIGKSLLTTLNRASGADSAGDSFWVAKQLQAAGQFEGLLSGLYTKQSTLHQGLGHALVLAGVTATLTPAQVLQAEQQVAAKGLPQSLIDALDKFGADATAITNITNVIKVQDINSVAGDTASSLTKLSLPSILTAAAQSLGGVCTRVDSIKVSLGITIGQPAFNPAIDLDSNGIIDIRDLAAAARQLPLGTTCP